MTLLRLNDQVIDLDKVITIEAMPDGLRFHFGNGDTYGVAVSGDSNEALDGLIRGMITPNCNVIDTRGKK